MKKHVLLFTYIIITAILHAQPCLPTVSYTFNGDLEDYSGNENDGILVNDANVLFDRLNIAYNDDDRLELPDSVLNGLDDFTMVFDFRIEDFNLTGAAPTNTFIAGASPTDEAEFVISYEKSVNSVVVAINGTGDYFPITLEENIWYCLKLIRDAGAVSVYIDGVLIETIAMTPGPLDISFIEIGQELDCPTGCYATNQCLNGSIDDFVIYPCVYTTSQCSPYIAPCDTLLIYELNTDVNDYSGNAFHGIINGDANVTSGYLNIGYNDDDYVEIPAAAINGLQEFAISFNFKLNDFNISGSSPTNTFIAGATASIEHEFALSFEKSSEAFVVAIHDIGGMIPATINVDEWYCITFYWNNDTISADLNGITLATTLVVPDDAINATFLEIGQEIDCVAGCFAENQSLNGSMENLIILDCIDKIHCREFPTAMNDIRIEENISLYPNPAKEHININYEKLKEFDVIKISDINGRTVYFNQSVKSNTTFISIDIKDYCSGLYLVTIINSFEGSVGTATFVIN